MDPTIEYSVIRDTFSKPIISPTPPLPYRSTVDTSPPMLQVQALESHPLSPSPCIHEQLYEQLCTIKTKFDNPSFNKHRQAGLPFENLSKTSYQYGNRAAIKLANICSVFSLLPNEDISFVHIDLCGAPGAFVEYVQSKRRDQVFSLVLSLSPPVGLPFDMSRLNDQRTIIYKGDDDSGDIFSCGPTLPSCVNTLTKEKSGIDDVPVLLITADGALEPKKGRDNLQECDTLRLIVSEVSTAVQCLHEGGSFVLKVFDIVEISTLQLLYLLSKVFDEFYLFKPMSSRPANSEKYVICKGFRSKSVYTDILSSLEGLPSDVCIHKFFEDDLPDDFVFYIYTVAETLMHDQIKYCKMIEDSMSGKRCTTTVKYNFNRALTSWGLSYTST